MGACPQCPRQQDYHMEEKSITFTWIEHVAMLMLSSLGYVWNTKSRNRSAEIIWQRPITEVGFENTTGNSNQQRVSAPLMAPEEWKISYKNIVHCSPALCLPHFYIFSRQFYMFLAVPSRLVPYSISFWCRRALRSPSRHAMQSVNTLKVIIYNVSEKNTKTLFRANLPLFSGQNELHFFLTKKELLRTRTSHNLPRKESFAPKRNHLYYQMCFGSQWSLLHEICIKRR